MYLIAKNPVMAEVEIPIKMIEKFISLFIKWGISTSPAPKMIGVASRKEKRAAARRSNPKASAVVIVTPERETPGIIAKA